MNILIVTAMFPPIRTGTSFYSRNLAAALAARGHAVTVATLVSNIPADDDCPFRVVRMPALHFPLRKYFKHLRFCSMFPGNYIRLSRLAREMRADVILLINHYLDISFPAIYAARSTGVKLAVSVGTQMQSLNPVRNRVLKILDRVVCGGMIFPFCDRVVAWDNEILRYLGDRQGRAVTSKAVIVPYGVNGDIGVFLGHHHDYSGTGQILGVGSVIEQRNFLSLVRVFARLREGFPHLRLKIVGHVYYDASVRLVRELGLAGEVEFTGEMTHEAVLEEMKKSDIFWGMLTAEYTGLGTASIEAMLMGLPVVSNAPENLLGDPFLRDMGNYVFSSDREIEGAAGKMAKVLSDPALRERIGRGGREYVSANMNWGKVAERMEKVLAETAGRGQQDLRCPAP